MYISNLISIVVISSSCRSKWNLPICWIIPGTFVFFKPVVYNFWLTSKYYKFAQPVHLSGKYRVYPHFYFFRWDLLQPQKLSSKLILIMVNLILIKLQNYDCPSRTCFKWNGWGCIVVWPSYSHLYIILLEVGTEIHASYVNNLYDSRRRKNGTTIIDTLMQDCIWGIPEWERKKSITAWGHQTLVETGEFLTTFKKRSWFSADGSGSQIVPDCWSLCIAYCCAIQMMAGESWTWIAIHSEYI